MFLGYNFPKKTLLNSEVFMVICHVLDIRLNTKLQQHMPETAAEQDHLGGEAALFIKWSHCPVSGCAKGFPICLPYGGTPKIYGPS